MPGAIMLGEYARGSETKETTEMCNHPNFHLFDSDKKIYDAISVWPKRLGIGRRQTRPRRQRHETETFETENRIGKQNETGDITWCNGPETQRW